MGNNYLFAVIAAMVVVLGGFFLLSRDGTEDGTVLTTEVGALSLELPINTSTSTDEEISEEPILEPGDSSATTEPIDLPEAEEEVGDVGIVTYTDAGFSQKP